MPASVGQGILCFMLEFQLYAGENVRVINLLCSEFGLWAISECVIHSPRHKQIWVICFPSSITAW